MASKHSSTGSSADFETSEHSDLVLDMSGFETTPADIEALKRIRIEDRRRYSLQRMHELQLPDWLAGPVDVSTSEGWEPFEL